MPDKESSLTLSDLVRGHQEDSSARRQQLMDRLTAARQQGVSWDAIHTSLNNRVEAARKAGVSQEAIQQSLGFNDPAELIAATQGEQTQHLGATKPASWLESFASGLTHSSSAALLGVTPDAAPVEGRWHQVMQGIGETLGDIPAMIVGGVTGASAGAAVGAIVGGGAGALVPVAGETGASEAAGGALGGGIGAALGAGAGTMALPQLIKSERDRYSAALNAGQVRGPEDYLAIQAQVAKDTVEAAGVGGLTAGAGRVAGPLLDKMGAGKVTKFLGTVAAEGGTMVTAQAALAGQMPRMEDYVDAAVTIGAFHTASHIAAPAARAIRMRLTNHYVETGEPPQAAAERAVNDPVFRAQMMGNPDPHVPAGSSRTALMSSTAHPSIVSDTYVVPRKAGDFDHAVSWMIDKGEGLTTTAGGVTKYGISAKNHPDVDVPNLSRDDAAEIYHKEYWRKIDADALPPNMRQVAFDSAVSEGVPQTKAWLKEAKGDFQKFMQLRVAKFANLARDPKHADATAGWADHIERLGAVAHANLPADIYQGLKARGIPDYIARGAAAGTHAESGGSAHALNPSSGAMGIGQWLGARKKELIKRYGSNPSLDQQLDFLVHELKGGDAGGASVLSARDEVDALHRYIRDFMRPAAGKETTGDLSRGMAALGRSGSLRDIANLIRGGPDNIGKEYTPEQSAILGLDMDGEGGGIKPPSGGSEGPPESSDPWEHVMGRVAPHEGTDWLGNTIDGFTRVYGELFDPSHPIRKLVDSVTKGEALDDYHNPELLFRVAENSGTVAQWAIEKQMVDLDGKVTGPALTDIASGKSVGAKFSNEDMKRFLDGYAVAKWAVMMDEQGKQTGVDIDKAKAVVADGKDKFENSFQHLVDWRNGTLKWLGDGGVHNKAKVDELIKENGSTIPGYRRMEDGSYKPMSTGKPGIWNPIKSAKGSERLVEPILKSLMQDAYLRHELAANNRSMLALADLGLKGNQATEKRAIDFNVISAIDALKERGIDEDMLSGLAESAGAAVPKDQVPLFRDGKLYGVKFEDAELTRVLRGYDQSARGTLMKVIAAITSVPRNFQTRFNPLFPVRLLTYDLPWQYIVNPDSKGPYSGFVTGLGHMTGDAEGYQAWLRSGGAERVFADRSKDAFIKRVMQGHETQSLGSNMWNAVKTPFDMLTAWTTLVSTPLKFGRYAKGVAQGETPLRAAVASSEAAFHRPGYGGPVGKAWNTIVPYTTAHLNGMEKSVRALLGVGRTVTGVKYDSKRTIIRATAMITAPVIAQWFAYKDEDWYKAMPEWQKDTAWFVIPPINGSPPIPIAAPPILSELFVALPRRLLEAFVADNPHATENIWQTLGAGLMPPGALTGASILTPIIEHIANYSFHRGRPLVDQNTVRGVQPAEQFTPYSSPAAKSLAQFASDLPLVHSNFGWSPAVIDNYITQWGGVMGRTAANAAASVLDSPSNPPVEQKVADWPGVSSWVVRYPSASAEPIQQFYDTTTKLTQEHGSLLKQIREGNFDAFKRIVDQGGPSAAAWQQLNLGQNIPPGVDLGPYLGYLAQASQGADYENLALAHQAADALKNARDYSWSVYEDHGKTGHDKRQILDMTNAQMQVMAERGNEAMDRALIGVKRRGASANAPVPDSIYFQPPQ